jgi:hypothetical protein
LGESAVLSPASRHRLRQPRIHALPDVTPVQVSDSGASTMQQMPVAKDFAWITRKRTESSSSRAHCPPSHAAGFNRRESQPGVLRRDE